MTPPLQPRQRGRALKIIGWADHRIYGLQRFLDRVEDATNCLYWRFAEGPEDDS